MFAIGMSTRGSFVSFVTASISINCIVGALSFVSAIDLIKQAAVQPYLRVQQAVHGGDPGRVEVDLNAHGGHVSEFLAYLLELILAIRVPEVRPHLMRTRYEIDTFLERVDRRFVLGSA